MVDFKLRLKFEDNHGRDLDSRLKSFVSSVKTAQIESGDIATKASRAAVKRTRPLADPRPGRHFEPIQDVIRWRPVSVNGGSDVGVNQQDLNTKSGHWLVQNIGTGRSGIAHVGGRPNPNGRPVKDATYVRPIPSQRGRRISAGLVFATGPTGQFVPPNAIARGAQQLHLREKVSFKAPLTGWRRDRSQAGIIIRREIEPQRFVQAGATQGFRNYRKSVLAAARSAFDKPKG